MADTPRRRYTKVDRAKALGIAMVKGQSAAADETGVPLSTLNQWWLDPKYGDLRSTAREGIVEQYLIAMQIGIEEVKKGLTSDAPLRDKAVAVSMLAEKFALFSGQATSRTETRELLQSFDDHEIDAVEAWLHDLARERLEASAAD